MGRRKEDTELQDPEGHIEVPPMSAEELLEAGKGAAKKKAKKTTLVISPPRMEYATFHLRNYPGSPLMMHRFGAKAREQMRLQQEAGSTARKGKKREPKDFMACYEDAKHITTEGWCGIPAGAFRAAMVSACKLVGFAMTRAKLSVFIEADGLGTDGTPLIKITKGEPEYCEMPVRNDGGKADLRARPRWREWEADIRIRYDADQFTLTDVANLMTRVGLQVGLLEGRPDSKKSAGMGYGMFLLVNDGTPED